MCSILIKFSEERYIDSLLSEGELFFNSLDNIVNCDKDGIGDDQEKQHRLFPSNFLIKSVNSEEWHSLTLNGPLTFKALSPFGNIYCMSILPFNKIIEAVEPYENIIDKRMENHGDFACLIYNRKEFINRVIKECLSKGYSVENFTVKYKTSEEQKSIPFQKDNSFSYQREYRFFIKNDKNSNPIKIQIGSIVDIAKKITPSDIVEIEIDKSLKSLNGTVKIKKNTNTTKRFFIYYKFADV